MLRHSNGAYFLLRYAATPPAHTLLRCFSFIAEHQGLTHMSVPPLFSFEQPQIVCEKKVPTAIVFSRKIFGIKYSCVDVKGGAAEREQRNRFS